MARGWVVWTKKLLFTPWLFLFVFFFGDEFNGDGGIEELGMGRG